MQVNDPIGPNRVVYRVLPDGEIEVIGGTVDGRRLLMEGIEDHDKRSTRENDRP